MITDSDSLELDRVQMQALKRIFGWRLSYSKLLEKSGLEKLSTRRETAFLKLAEKMSNNKRYSSWFPLRLHRRSQQPRNAEKYKVYPARNERYSNSPLNIMRRELNQMNTC